ncbi:MAG: GntR family transcriptional regulator [Ardenticatenaceae bacterium]|nr:GntR family transcriptional regulator [Ardenticatenaceae bacterium]
MQPIQKSAPLASIAYERIKQSILNGTLAPAQTVHEPQLAQRLQISRTPVREALIRLEQEGWLMPADGRGLIVRPLSPRGVEDIYEMRLLLEPHAARLFAERADDAAIADLLEPLEEIEAEIAVGRYELFFQMHRAVHQKLIDHCPNLILREGLALLDERMHRIRALTGSEPGRHVRASFEEQKAILRALERRDLNQIEHAVADHLSAAKERVLTHLAATTWFADPEGRALA